MRLQNLVELVGIAVTCAAIGLGCQRHEKRDDAASAGKPTAVRTKDAGAPAPAAPMAAASESATLYDRLGGEPAIRAVIEDFVPRAAGNPKVRFTREGVPGARTWQA